MTTDQPHTECGFINLQTPRKKKKNEWNPKSFCIILFQSFFFSSLLVSVLFLPATDDGDDDDDDDDAGGGGFVAMADWRRSSVCADWYTK